MHTECYQVLINFHFLLRYYRVVLLSFPFAPPSRILVCVERRRLFAASLFESDFTVSKHFAGGILLNISQLAKTGTFTVMRINVCCPHK